MPLHSILLSLCDRIIAKSAGIGGLSVITRQTGHEKTMENPQTQNLLEKLGNKVAEMMQQLESLKEENGRLKNDLMNRQAENEVFKNQIERLEADNAAKEREIEEIVNKIESILG
jgi:predicted RNase H-like nuclease (RuvC/YqgF family)